MLLPLLWAYLSKTDLGMHFVLATVGSLVVILDFGFSISIGRNVGYAMGGAQGLHGHGLSPEEASGTPNKALLWQLLTTTRHLYRYLSTGAFLLMGVTGTLILSAGPWVSQTSSPKLTWIAWGITLASAVLEMYAGWWTVFLRGMNEVLLSTRIAALGQAIKLVVAASLLVSGAGLISLPAAGLLSSLLQRSLARHRCLGKLGARPSQDLLSPSLLRILWPNTWRVGVQFLSGFLAGPVNIWICTAGPGLAASSEFGPTLQVVTIIQGMSLVWTSVKWPLVAQYSAQRDFPRLHRMLQPRVWLVTLTYFVLAVLAAALGPAMLKWFEFDKELLPTYLFVPMLVNGFLETQFGFWTTLLSMENRIPSLWPTVATNFASFVSVVLGIFVFGAGLEVIVYSQLILGSLFGYWYWPVVGARSLGTTWFKFMFARAH